jgi:hypothetical protein
MKKILVIAGLLFTGSAFAQSSTVGGTQSTNCPGGATTCAGATSNSGSQATNAGNNVLEVGGIVVNIPQGEAPRDTTTRQLIDGRQEVIQSGTSTVKNVPSVSGPPLVSSNDTCMGSSSGSVNAPGFGVSLGTTWTDNNCRMLKNSRELWNMGMKAAALALMCTDPMNREALELTGFKCPQSKDESQRVVKADGTHYTDPIVRARLGLSPLE